jgi:hypothetical protein
MTNQNEIELDAKTVKAPQTDVPPKNTAPAEPLDASHELTDEELATLAGGASGPYYKRLP